MVALAKPTIFLADFMAYSSVMAISAAVALFISTAGSLALLGDFALLDDASGGVTVTSGTRFFGGELVLILFGVDVSVVVSVPDCTPVGIKRLCV